MRRAPLLVAILFLVLLAACAHRKPNTLPTPGFATRRTVDSLWTMAVNLYQRGKWGDAGPAFDRVELELPPGDRRILVGRMYLGDIYAHEGSKLEAVREYRRLSDDFQSDSLAPEALLHAADAYLSLWRRAELDPTYGYTAQTTYQELLTRYPSAPAAARARDHLKELDDRFALKAYQAGNYYLKYKAYDSAILYFKDLVHQWPQAAIVPDAVEGLVFAYRKLGYIEDVNDMCAYLRLHAPQRPKLNTTCPPTASSAGKPKGP